MTDEQRIESLFITLNLKRQYLIDECAKLRRQHRAVSKTQRALYGVTAQILMAGI